MFVLSAFSSTQVCAECASLGVDVFLRKPIAAEKVCERIRLWRSGRKRMAREENAVALEVRVTEVIHQVGVPAHIKGYQYLREAIMMRSRISSRSARSPRYCTRRSQRNSIRPRRVLSAPSATRSRWRGRGDLETLQSYFGYTVSGVKGKPTNSEFISMIADRLRLQMRFGA